MSDDTDKRKQFDRATVIANAKAMLREQFDGLCPACGGDDIYADSAPEVDATSCIQRIDCCDCDHAWYECYELTQIAPAHLTGVATPLDDINVGATHYRMTSVFKAIDEFRALPDDDRYSDNAIGILNAIADMLTGDDG